MMKRTVLGFCGINPVKVTEFGPVIDAKENRFEKWLAKARLLGAGAV